MTTKKDKLAAAQAEAVAAHNKVAAAQLRAKEADDKAQAIAAEIQKERDEALLEALTPAVISALAPDHGCADCDDKYHANGSRGCARCVLLSALEERYFEAPWKFTVEQSS